LHDLTFLEVKTKLILSQRKKPLICQAGSAVKNLCAVNKRLLVTQDNEKSPGWKT